MFDSVCMHIISGVLQVGHFCESGESAEWLHDSTLPTKHNSMCGRQSTWDVIRKNEDFNSGSEYVPGAYDDAPETEFEILRPGSGRFVFVLDNSGSMVDDQDFPTRLDRLKMASERWLRKDVREGSQVGITTFR